MLFAQPELDEHLNRREIRQLKQRITFSYKLSPIDPQGMSSYVSHRLVTAGYQGGELFADMALKRLYKSSRGVPRLINILSHKAMMVAYGRGDDEVNINHMKMAIKDTDDAQRCSRYSSDFRRNSIWVVASLAVAGLAGVVFQAVG